LRRQGDPTTPLHYLSKIPQHHGNPTPPHPWSESPISHSNWKTFPIWKSIWQQRLARTDAAQYKFGMTTNEFCESSGLAPRELRRWLETGLLEADTIGIPGGGHR
jgi:hypothetical protein